MRRADERRGANGITELRRCIFTGNATTQAIAFRQGGSTLTIEDTEVLWSGAATTEKGIEALAGLTVVRSSEIRADTALDVASGAFLEAAYSQAWGALSGTGSYTCIGLYDQNLAAVTCP